MTPRIPRDISKADVLRALARLGFSVDREHEHIALKRMTAAGTTLLIIPNHRRIKLSTLLAACLRAGITRDELLRALAG